MELEGENVINVQKYDLSQVQQKVVIIIQKVFILAQRSQRVCNREGWGVQEGEGNEKQRKDQKLRR